jgi:hypothetical protein
MMVSAHALGTGSYQSNIHSVNEMQENGIGNYIQAGEQLPSHGSRRRHLAAWAGSVSAPRQQPEDLSDWIAPINGAFP